MEVANATRLASLVCPFVRTRMLAWRDSAQHDRTLERESFVRESDTTTGDSTTVTLSVRAPGGPGTPFRFAVVGPNAGPVTLYLLAVRGAPPDSLSCAPVIFETVRDILKRDRAGKRVELARGSITIGPQPLRFGAAEWLPASGPRNILRIEFPTGYRIQLSAPQGTGPRHFNVVGPSDVAIDLRAAIILPDSTRRELRQNGVSKSGDHVSVNFVENVHPDSLAEVPGVEISANVPVTAARIEWWTGDLRAQMVWP